MEKKNIMCVLVTRSNPVFYFNINYLNIKITHIIQARILRIEHLGNHMNRSLNRGSENLSTAAWNLGRVLKHGPHQTFILCKRTHRDSLKSSSMNLCHSY